MADDRCSICRRALNVATDPFSEDCGGDCLLCMADAGDPECVEAVRQVLRTQPMAQDDLPAGLFDPDTCIFHPDKGEHFFTPDPDLPAGEESLHYLRRCRACGGTWWSHHCRCEQPLRTCGCTARAAAG